MASVVALTILLVILLGLIILGISMVTMLFIRVPFVPSSPRVVAEMIRIAAPGAGDVFYDLGCGDGRLVHEAGKMGARAVGYELSLLPYLLAVLRGKLMGSPARIEMRDFFGVSLKEATVIVTYLTPGVMGKLAEKLNREAQSGLRLIAHGFALPGKDPVAHHRLDGGETVYVYQW